MLTLSLDLLRQCVQRLSLRQMSSLSLVAMESSSFPNRGQSFGIMKETEKNGRPSSNKEGIICPTNSLTCVILDVSISNPKSCPTFHKTEVEFLLPNPLTGFYTEKEAPTLYDSHLKEAVDDLRRQRSRMNKHKLRRYRHENLMDIREHRHRKLEKRAKEDLKVIERFRTYSANFNAEEKVMQDLETARRGGFYVECFGPNREDKKNAPAQMEDKSLDIL
ncbi:uncharacterized protein LOC133172717 [Saccostrea echinata]|uniref:uncharacterized protein LOC133172717 n=1 Tax=Saccostrea echinata TaxID=191078 RepID=UPI002A7F0FEE|nr:uncharacterized protein LOC133172717 [Saccostrea echinata]